MGDPLRGTGRTYSIINLAADCVQDGQPNAMVVILNDRMVDYAKRMMIDCLRRRGVDIKKVSRSLIHTDVSDVQFVTLENYCHVARGMAPCDFIDHSVWRRMTNMQRDIAIMRNGGR